MVRSFFASVAVACLFTMPSFADRRHDDGADGVRNSSMWSQTQSRSNSREGKSLTGISESKGKIRIDGKKGKGGSAAYVSAWEVDWTDGFVLEFEHELACGKPKSVAQSATSGLAMGFGTFDAAAGWMDGINVNVVRGTAGRSLQVSVRIGGVAVDSQSVQLDSGAHDLSIVWTSVAGAISMDVMADGYATPLVSVDGIETWFAGHEAEGMGISLFGTSSGKFKFESTFDNVSFSGDDYNDSDDAGYDDDDGADDADEDGSDDADDSEDDSDSDD